MATTTKTETNAPTKSAQPSLFNTAGLEPIPAEVEREDSLALEVKAGVRAEIDSLLSRAGEDRAKIERELENRHMILDNARAAVIKRSKPQDWTLYKGPEGEVTGIPRDSILVTAKKVYGIQTFNYRPMTPDGPNAALEPTGDVIEREGKEPVKVFTATLWCDAICGLTGERFEGARFTARTGRFAGQEENLNDLRQSARTGLDSLVVRKLTGIRKVSGEELTAAGIKLEKCYKGHGYGSSSERGAAKVADAGIQERVAKLKKEILQATGGDETGAAYKEIARAITRSDDGSFKGFDSLERITADWQLDGGRGNKGAIKRWTDHPMNKGASGREPGAEG